MFAARCSASVLSSGFCLFWKAPLSLCAIAKYSTIGLLLVQLIFQKRAPEFILCARIRYNIIRKLLLPCQVGRANFGWNFRCTQHRNQTRTQISALPNDTDRRKREYCCELNTNTNYGYYVLCVLQYKMH